MKVINECYDKWLQDMISLCRPAEVIQCDGSSGEKTWLTNRAIAEGVLLPLNQEKLPGCYCHRSAPDDVARVEQCTFVCTNTAAEAGPTNNWAHPLSMKKKLFALARDSMKGRTMYVVPYVMGPPGSPLCRVGVELTDSIYVALSMRLMTRVGDLAWGELGRSSGFNRGLHCMLDLNPASRCIAHFPQEDSIISVASNYGGNVLLGKKCMALRIGSFMGKSQGWLAEHMLIVAIEAPDGKRTYVAAAFPSACGKTNLAMLKPPPRFQGWKIWTIGDDIAWMKPGEDGRLYAVNPETGYFGVLPGTNQKSNPVAMDILSSDTIFTNVATTGDGDVWWEGKTKIPPRTCLDWRGRKWTPESTEKAAHPNSRFTSAMSNNPILAPEVYDPRGVPISAIIFGGRRSDTVPLVYQALDWSHGAYIGATMGSETTAAASGATGHLRRDPMAMLPFCGYDITDYFQHWIAVGKNLTRPPLIFSINWFRLDERGNFLWPGFGENMRVLKWIVERCHNQCAARATPLGWMPLVENFDLQDMPGFDATRFAAAQAVKVHEWQREFASQDAFFSSLGGRLPRELLDQRENLKRRLEEMPLGARAFRPV